MLRTGDASGPDPVASDPSRDAEWRHQQPRREEDEDVGSESEASSSEGHDPERTFDEFGPAALDEPRNVLGEVLA